MKKVKALVLLSGGLDSMLAVKILGEQGAAVTGIVFVSNFYNAKRAQKVAEQINIPLKIIDISSEMLELVKNPPSGHGKNLNPCIDCHALMIKKASEIAQEEGFDIVATGETLGQRPFSQNKQSLTRVAKLSGIDVLRPLSAKLLPPTKYEKEGLIDRERLLNIEGRSREKQMELAKKFGIKEYPHPGGGCMLTEPSWSEKLGQMLTSWPNCNINDVELLKNGRSFWANFKDGLFKKKKSVLIIVGRDKEDNEQLDKLARENDIIIELKDKAGPTTLLRVKNYKIHKIKSNDFKINIPKELDIKSLKLENLKNEKEILEVACLLTGWYLVKARGKEVILKVKNL